MCMCMCMCTCMCVRVRVRVRFTFQKRASLFACAFIAATQSCCARTHFYEKPQRTCSLQQIFDRRLYPPQSRYCYRQVLIKRASLANTRLIGCRYYVSN